MPYLYMLRCADGSFYVGSTYDLDGRVRQHGDGRGAQYTRRRLPIELAWSQECSTIDEAFTLEKQIQGGSRVKRIALIEGRWGDLPGLSRPRRR